MATIHLETNIEAPVELCYDLALTVEAHEDTIGGKGHGRAVAGVTSGRMKLGDTVTWEATHFGVRQRLTSRIVAAEPSYIREGTKQAIFVDEMQQGAFKYWRHKHIFQSKMNGTLMIDKIEFAAPFGFIGRIVDALVLKEYMTRFLIKHNENFKKIAERKSRVMATKL